MLDRIRITFLYLPIVIGSIYLGGPVLALALALVLILSTLEYVAIFRTGGYHPSPIAIAAGILLILAFRYFFAFAHIDILLSLVVLLGLVFYMLQYERGVESAALDYAISLMGVLYLGWLGAYAISLRAIPGTGLAWTLIILPATWLGDSLAYAVGVRWGRHKLSPRLSPKKTWEGYLGSALGGVMGGLLFTWLAVLLTRQPEVYTLGRGVIVGIVMGLLPTLGDLGESLFKRAFGVKDSGHTLGAHGGFLDRIDSWLWALILGYYLVTLFFQ